MLDASLTAGLRPLNDEANGQWAERCLVSPRLAIPLGEGYKELAAKWDETFRNRQLFRLLDVETVYGKTADDALVDLA
jgi:hypothetical protein